MPDSLAQWHMEIGYFSNYSSKHLYPSISLNTRDISYKFAFSRFSSIIFFVFFFILSMSIVYAKVYFSIFLYKVKYTRVYFSWYAIYNFCYVVLLHARYYIYIILLCGDVELNSGIKPNSSKCFSICHWNLNSITSHSFIKVSLLSAYNTVHNFDIICISQSSLNSQICSNDDKLSIPGCNMFSANHPSDNPRRWVWLQKTDLRCSYVIK